MPQPQSKTPAPQFNYRKFMQYLGETFVSIVLAPALAFAISFLAYLLGNTSATLTSILWECLYVDVLFSILTICVIVTFRSEYKAQREIRRCFGKASAIYTYLRNACIVVLVLLVVLETFYKLNTGSPIQNNWLYNVTEVVGFCICIITQCLSHPQAYFCP